VLELLEKRSAIERLVRVKRVAEEVGVHAPSRDIAAMAIVVENDVPLGPRPVHPKARRLVSF
jgi:hypothetical protein